MPKKANLPIKCVRPVGWSKTIPVGYLVWAKISSSPWWPAIVIPHGTCGLKPPKQSAVWVLWFGDYRVSEVLLSQLQSFPENFAQLFDRNNKGVKLNAGVREAIQIHAGRCGERGWEKWSVADAISWISSLSSHLLRSKLSKASDQINADLPELVNSKLEKIKLQQLELSREESKRKNEESDDDDGMNGVSKKWKADAVVDASHKITVITKVKDKQLRLQDICICCAREKTNLNHEHPYFEGKVCDQCFEELKDTNFAIGEDGVHFHCVICTQRGDVVICDDISCRRVYCHICIDAFCPKNAKTKIIERNPWNCFLCSNHDKHLNGLLKKREDWPVRIARMYITSPETEVMPEIERRPLRVLSLFDGIGTGLCVLKKLNLDIEVYYASEIDDDAIHLTAMNHGAQVTHLGGIEALSNSELLKLAPIDLLIGGSPCNELSGVNHARRGLYDACGTGVLFFDFYRVLEFLKNNNKGRPLFWLFENVCSMPKEYRKVITRFLGCDPTVVDARYFSAQSRSRFFWGNIPSLKSAQQTAMDIETRPELNSILTRNCNREAVVETVGTVTTNSNSLRQGKEASMPVVMNGRGDTLWVPELEELFGFPRHYTDSGNFSATKRLRLLGKAWSIPVLCHILKPLTAFYSSKDSESD